VEASHKPLPKIALSSTPPDVTQLSLKDRCLLRQTSGVPRPGLKRGPAPESQAERERRLWPRAARLKPLRFRQTPLLAAALCFALGESFTKIPPPNSRPTILLLLATIALTALALLALRRTLRIALLPLATLWLAAGLWSAQLEPSPPPQTSLLAYADGLSRTVQARIVRIRTLPTRPADPTDSNTDTDPDQ